MTMTMHRRDFLKAGAAVSLAAALPSVAYGETAFAPVPGAWRTFELVTRVEVAQPSGSAQAWVPLPAVDGPDWFRPMGSTWKTNATAASIVRDAKYGAQMLHAQWATGETTPVVEVTSRFATRDRAVDFTAPGNPPGLGDETRALYTSPSALIPTDGIVAETSGKITTGASGQLAKARAIYAWIVDNTFRDPKVRGCGLGNIKAMLETGNLGGKCADLNALYVGLARAAGLPARDVYGLRVAASRFGYKSLGASTEVVTKAQHCRAEVYLDGFGWVPVDPADVRKVVLEEPPGNLSLDDPKVVAARQTLFGSWEMNWLAYNTAHDVSLPGAQGPELGFLMYPQAEIAGARLDCLDPDNFRYKITATELSA
jgi:transglutaminase-like putative cysteine protease